MNPRNESATYRVGFILEQTLGHATHSQNLQASVPHDSAVDAHWGLLTFETDGLTRHVPIYGNNWTIRAGFRARKIIGDLQRDVGLDALFFHTQVAAVLSMRWMQRIPSIVSLDATPLQYDRFGELYAHSIAPAWLERWKWHRYRTCFRKARHIVSWSEWTRQSLIREYEVPAEHITVIPPGVDTKAWGRQNRRDLSSPVIRILFVGADLRRKGGLLLLETFRRLRQLRSGRPGGREVELQLHLVTRDAVSSEPGVFIHRDLKPNSAALKQLYWDSHIFCLPTYADSFAIVLSEAAAAGLPAVSTRVGAIPELVQDGETGFLIPPGDAQALEAALQRLVADPDMRVHMGARSAAVARERLDASNNTSRILTVVKRAIREVRATTHP